MAVWDIKMRPNQAGFRPGSGCVDQMFTLRVLEHRFKYLQPSSIQLIERRFEG